MPRITADYLYSPEGFLTDHFLEIDESGQIIQFSPLSPETKIDQTYKGALIPGLVNAHCHLELSMLKGQIPRGTGMTGFIFQIVSQRGKFSEEEQIKAVHEAMKEAWDTGTVAIGDICNSSISVGPKQENLHLYCHSFIELLGLNGAQAEGILAKGQETAKAFEELAHSLTLHAPYSMSSELIDSIYQSNSSLISVHLLESKEERAIFEKSEGPFLDFYAKIGVPFSSFPTKSALEYALNSAKKEQPILSVHNTEITQKEVDQLTAEYPNLYFALCPRTNEYIHQTQPSPHLFHNYIDRVCLGTDSLASNDSLDLFEEVKTLWRNHDSFSTHTLIKWATTNGAKAMRLSDKFGTFAAGMQPGVNLLKEIDLQEIRLTEKSHVQKLY